jgi:hypothetical protein
MGDTKRSATLIIPLIAKLSKAIWLYMAGIVAVLAIYYLLTGVEQGIDVVIQAGEYAGPGIFTVLAVFLWAFLVWYSGRILSYIKQCKDSEIYAKRTQDDVTAHDLYYKNCIPTSVHQHIPRMLAYNCFVSIQVAIFHLPTFHAFKGWVMVLVILAYNGFYFLNTAWFTAVKESIRWKRLALANGVVIAGFSLFLLYQIIEYGTAIDIINSTLRHQFWLRIVALLMFTLQVICIYFFVQRRLRINIKKIDPLQKRSILLSKIGFNPLYNAAEAPYFNTLNIITLVALLIYLAAIFNMQMANG